MKSQLISVEDLEKSFLFYTIINYQFKTSVLKNVGKLVEQTVKAYKALLYKL